MLENIALGLLWAIAFIFVCVFQKRLGFLRSPVLSFCLGCGYTTGMCSSFVMWLATLVVVCLVMNKVKWTENEWSDGQPLGTNTRLSGFVVGQLVGGLWIGAGLAWNAMF